MLKYQLLRLLGMRDTVEAPVTGHPQEEEIVSVTGAGHSPE